MFIGRAQELQALETRYQKTGFAFPVIYGRRRIGKTRLIQEFIRNKKAIYFMATEQNAKEQLVNLTAAVKEQFPDERTHLLSSFENFDALFAYLTEISQKERLIFVIDEYPYLAKTVPEISSILQKYIDQFWQNSQLYLILCGSSMSFMERQVLSYQSPLYGRRTAQLKLEPLPYYEAIQFFPDWSDEDKLYAYGICDGIPQYLHYLSQYENLETAVTEELLTSSGHLQEEPENLMLQELREPATYNSILTAIAHGASRQNEISTAVGKDASKLSFYLNNLIDLGIIIKKQPVEEKNKKKNLYQIADNLYRFWYRFIPECSSLIAMGLGRQAWQRRILPHFSEYFGHIFEDICMQYLKYQIAQGHIDILYSNYGSWWGTNPQKRREEEIDIVCSDEHDILCGECKWRNEPIDLSVLATLRERAALIQRNRRVHYALFAKSGFQAPVVDAAKTEDLLLVTPKELLFLV